MALDIYLQATYEDGLTLVEDETDTWPLDPSLSFFGGLRKMSYSHPLVQLDLVTPGVTYPLDWTSVPAGAVPVREKYMEATLTIDSGELSDAALVGIDFGYEYPSGDHVVRTVTELR